MGLRHDFRSASAELKHNIVALRQRRSNPNKRVIEQWRQTIRLNVDYTALASKEHKRAFVANLGKSVKPNSLVRATRQGVLLLSFGAATKIHNQMK